MKSLLALAAVTIALFAGASAYSQTALPVYPPQAQTLPPISLADLIYDALPKAGTEQLGWEYMLDAPVLWITDGFSEDIKTGWSERVGVARVRANGAVSTVLRQRRQELGWTVRLATHDNPKFGPTEIDISPGVPKYGCFGTLFDGCDFPVSAAIGATKFTAKLVCRREEPGAVWETYAISADGKEPELLLYTESSGSGGSSSDIEIHPTSDRLELCKAGDLEQKAMPPVARSSARPGWFGKYQSEALSHFMLIYEADMAVRCGIRTIRWLKPLQDESVFVQMSQFGEFPELNKHRDWIDDFTTHIKREIADKLTCQDLVDSPLLQRLDLEEEKASGMPHP